MLLANRLDLLLISIIFIAFVSIFSFAAGKAEEQFDSPYVFRVEISGCSHKPTETPGAENVSTNIDRYQPGFVVQGIKGIVTALHGVADCNKFAASSVSSGVRYDKLELTQINIDLDLAVLSLDNTFTSNEGFIPATGAPISDKGIYMIGHPRGSYAQIWRRVLLNLKPLSFLNGLPEALQYELDKRGSPSLDAGIRFLEGVSILSGDSGAPILAEDNQVIGVVNGALYDRGSSVPWAILWNQQIVWERPDNNERFDRLKEHNVLSLFSFSTDVNISDTENEVIQIALSEGITPFRNITTTHKIIKNEAAIYQITFPDNGLHNFDSNYVVIGKETAENVVILAQGDISSDLNSLHLDYMKFRFDKLPSLFTLTIIPAGQAFLPSPRSVNFKVTVVDECDQSNPIQGATVTFAIKQNNRQIGDEKEYSTETPGSASITVENDRPNLKVYVTVNHTGYDEFTKTYDLLEEGVVIPLSPLNNCLPLTATVTPTKTETLTVTVTRTVTAIPAVTETSIPAPNATVTSTPTLTRPPTDTPTATHTAILTPTATPTPSATVTPLYELESSVLLYRKMEEMYYTDPSKELLELENLEILVPDGEAYIRFLHCLKLFKSLREENKTADQITHYTLINFNIVNTTINMDEREAFVCVSEEYSATICEGTQAISQIPKKLDNVYELGVIQTG
jgi:hypothetical protein